MQISPSLNNLFCAKYPGQHSDKAVGSIIISQFQYLCGVSQILSMPVWVSGFLPLPKKHGSRCE